MSSTMLVLSMTTGCQTNRTRASQSADTAQPEQTPGQSSAPTTQWSVTPLAADTVDLPVKEGPAPLVYLIESAGAVRVVDATSGRALGQGVAQRQTIVSVDATRGVSIAGISVTRGPLPPDDRYAIYFNTGGFSPENDIRVRTERTDPIVLHKKNKDTDAAVGATTAPSPQP